MGVPGANGDAGVICERASAAWMSAGIAEPYPLPTGTASAVDGAVASLERKVMRGAPPSALRSLPAERYQCLAGPAVHRDVRLRQGQGESGRGEQGQGDYREAVSGCGDRPGGDRAYRVASAGHLAGEGPRPGEAERRRLLVGHNAPSPAR